MPNYNDNVINIFGSSLLAYWPLWEPSGSVADDISGNGRNGVNTAVTLAQGGIGDGHTAASYNGTTSYTNVYSTSLRDAFNGAAGTLMVWGKVSAAGVWTDGAQRYLALFNATSNNRLAITKAASNNILTFFYIAGAVNKTVNHTSFSPTTYFHAVLTWDKAADEVKAYVNGVQVGATLTGLGTWAGLPAATTTTIGAGSTVPGTVWSGSLAHVAIGNRALTATEVRELSVIPSDTSNLAAPLSFYLITEKAPVAFTGRVNGTPADPYMAINYSSGVTGSFGAPLPGMTVWLGSTSGGQERGVLRLRSWSAGGSLSVAESDDVGPTIQANDYITIRGQWRLWPIYPRAVIAGNDATMFIDYDTAYSDQLSNYKPVAVAGPPAIVEYNGTNAQARFVGDRSFALAVGATLTGYLWTAPGSVEGTSASQGTEASPVTFTWTSTGQKLVYLRVTDSNGKTATNYTWVFVVDPNNPTTVAYVNFDAYNDNFDYEQGGGSCTFTVKGSAAIADFPNEAMIVMASRPTTPGQTTPTGYWPNRDNVHFVGYIVGNTVRQNPVSGDVTFTAVTIDTLMRNVTAFPVSLTYRNAPQDWTMAAHLTTDRAASYLWHYHSTLSLMASIRPSNYAGLIQRQDFGPNGGIHSQLDSELMASLWGKVVVNHQGVVHHLIDYNLMNNTERAAVTVRKTLHKGVWVDDLNIEERHAYSLPVNVVKMSGVLYPGGEIDDVCPLFSESPGNAPKVYGSEINYDRLILTSQTDLNIRCGRALAKQNAKYSGFGLRFINDGSFTIAPQELFTSNIEAADNDRGLALTTRLLPRRISRTFDNQGMYIAYDVGFEPETDGPPGVTVDLPCGPPEQRMPNNRPPGTPQDTSLPSSLAASTEGSSFYFAQKPGQVWQRRVNGLTSLVLLDMIPDPWSTFKNGHSIDHIILWGCGSSFLTRSPDTGLNWEDHTPYLDSPPNSWGDATAPNVTGTVIKQVLGDLFREDTLYLLAQNQGTGTAYRGWIGRSTDAGFTFSWYALTGTAQTYPIRMDVDKQDGTLLWVTTWESGTIFLRKHAVSNMALTTKYTLMTGTTSAQVLGSTYLAHPFAPLGDKNKIYIYGRLTNPQGLAGTFAIIQSANGGSSWTGLISDWATNVCGSFFASEASGGQRKFYAVRQGT